MNVGRLVGALLPVFFVLALGYIGGKRHSSATSGVAVFTVGLTLATHSFHISRFVVLGTIGGVTVQTAVLFALFSILRVSGPFARESMVCTSFPMATTVVLFAAKYKALEAETASILLLSTLALLITVPLTLMLGR